MSQAILAADPYLNSNLFSGYYLDERIDDLDAWDCDTEARDAFEKLQTLWELEGDLVDSYNEDELLDSWIDEVLDVLGFGTLSETTLPNSDGYNDRLLFGSEDTRRDAARRKKSGDVDAMYGLAAAILEAKQWDANFTERFAEYRSYRDASHQIKYYLERTPERVRWGVLTDGRKWRLYGTKDYATETYYEVDLPELLESDNLEAFKYFYVFFRPDAFAETAGTSFLDTVWSESETAAQELGEDLQDNVFTALRVLGEGFVATNDLDIDPDDAAARDELKEQSLVLLYRLMFVLYAESRGLIHPDNPAAEAEYEENFSLTQLRSEIHGAIQSGESFADYSEFSTTMWSRLQDLFGLVDAGEQSLGIPPYNGGLFDDDAHEFLAEHAVADRYVAEVVYRLGTTETDDGQFVLADYADLDTRHLGAIYEGLLEHEFRIAPEQYAAVAEDGGQVWRPATEVTVADAVETVEAGGLYVVNDEGERKATGAYYTPDYVVAYIVEETVDPLIAELKKDLAADGLEPSDGEYFFRFLEGVRDLRILDPAMGSGHFLTKATGYLTEQVMEIAREQEVGFGEDEIRRKIAKECIYGVDVNGMAVELAKLSMWLETLAADQPLAFLDHHLKTGNSLVGSDITEVLSNGDEEEGGQLTLMQAFDRTRRRTLDHVMDRMQELLEIDNENLEDIKSMEEIYADIRADPLYRRLFELANVHTAEQFGLDVPENADERMAGAIEDEAEWAEIQDEDWFASAQAMADEETFFHWKLEFPEVFFDIDGEQMNEAGFDAVVGNPPYGAAFTKQHQRYLDKNHTARGIEYDSYIFFKQCGLSLLKQSGEFGFIIPSAWTKIESNEPIREYILDNTDIRQVVDCDKIFESAGSTPVVDTLILILTKTEESTITEIRITKGNSIKERLESLNQHNWRRSYQIEQKVFKQNNNQSINYDTYDPDKSKIIDKIESKSDKLQEISYIGQGVTAYDRRAGQSDEIVENRAYHSNEKENESYGKWLSGSDIGRYQLNWSGEWLSYGNWLVFPRDEDLFTDPRILFREVTGGLNRIIATYTEEEYYYGHSVIPAVVTESNHDGLAILAIVNSKLLSYYNLSESPNAQKDVFPKMNPSDVENLPIILDISEEKEGELISLSRQILDRKEKYENLNLSLLDHLGSYADGPTLSEIGLTQPPEGSADSILQQTAEERPNLRVGDCEVVRESDSTVEIRLTARYKPGEAQPEGAPQTGTSEARGSDDDPEAHETDRWGYTETEPLPALRITDLTAAEADLIEAFVPVAVDEAGGFADFRETATKTNSLVDRLRALTLPAVADVRDGLESYRETVARAEDLETKIERTDDLIDEIVYELYGLTDEEIEIVEEAVGE